MFAVLLLAASAFCAPAASGTPFPSCLAAARKAAPSGFTVVPQAPFVVVGDEAPDTVRMRAVSTVKWAVDMLKKDYFTNDPAETITVWLFRDKASYTKHTAELFNDTPTTPFGYYSTEHHALIMNIGTGGGTLVHEIVHPFIRANFLQCPAWFNEGLASLYEQAAEKDGHIVGLTNWRLDGLQKDIRSGSTVSFNQLASMGDFAFYGGTNTVNYNDHYAQARYLCYYLQQHGLLVKYYHAFVANATTDPTGYTTLQQTLGEKDMADFRKRWEKYVLSLTFP